MQPGNGNLDITPAFPDNQDNSLDPPLTSNQQSAQNTVTTTISPSQSVFSSTINTFPNSLQDLRERSATASPSSSSQSRRTTVQSNSLSSSASTPRRRPLALDASISILDSTLLPSAEKDTDDPSTPIQTTAHMHTPASLSKLLGARFEISPDVSRHSSYTLGNANLLRATEAMDGASLPDHLYTRGLLAGKHSDIAIIAFGQRYNLHRIILDRAPFFAMAFAEPWTESQAKEISLHPQAVDSSITQNAFELALRRLYGCDISDEEDSEAVGLFATGCWLEMQEIIDSAIDSILRRLTPENLGSIIRLVTANYYGPAGERILASSKAMLCRDGWDMPLKYWDMIPADIIREVVGGDGFFIFGEWERWNQGRRLLDRRLKLYSLEFGLLKISAKKQTAPQQLLQWLPRFTSNMLVQPSWSDSGSADTEEDKWYTLYTHPEIEPLYRLLDSGIHYIHLEFEHLQYIRQSRDVFGIPVVPESVVLNALFMQLELRQRVVNARDSDIELGLTTPVTTPLKSSFDESETGEPLKTKRKGKAPEKKTKEKDEDMTDSEYSAPGKFFIPSADCNMVMGGASETIVPTGTGTSSQRMASRLSNNSTDPDMPSVDDSDMAGTRLRPSSSSDPPVTQQRPPPLAYTQFPPFRFSASFPAPRVLKEKKRMYSRTVFYAGSLWNIYIQKMRAARNFQLGVYLHRAKERDMTDELHISRPPTSVDERIGILEREMLMRGEQRSYRGRGSRLHHAIRQHRAAAARQGDSPTPIEVDSSRLTTASSTSTLFSHRGQRMNAFDPSAATLQNFMSFDTDSADSDSSTLFDAADSNPTSENPLEDSPVRLSQQTFIPPRIPALPPYTDSRSTIRTYFKIYSPSKAGRLLSVYESAPDKFDFSQSWGWRSSTLMLDEGLEEAEEEQHVRKGRNNGILRFSIVLGNL